MSARILLWHVHGSWTTAFVQGAHRYVVPVLPDRGPDGRGRARTWDWPPSVVERTPLELRDEDIDLVVLQRPHEEDLCRRWLGRRPGLDVAAVYLEHNAPQGRIADLRHVAADRPELEVVHVTHFNRLFWDTGGTPTTVIEHGICDPGRRYRGDLPAAAVVSNELLRRGRVVGADLLPRLSEVVPIDLFGMGANEAAAALGPRVRPHDDVPQHELHVEMGRRRAYLHPVRWTSLGLSLLEAMMIGMPVVALDTTEVREAVPESAGVVTNRIEVIEQALAALGTDRAMAREMGEAAREAATARYGLARFLADWDRVIRRRAGIPATSRGT